MVFNFFIVAFSNFFVVPSDAFSGKWFIWVFLTVTLTLNLSVLHGGLLRLKFQRQSLVSRSFLVLLR